MVGEVLKSLREENKLTQKQIADIMKIDRSTYAYYETGRTVPDLYAIALLANIYNITPEYIVGLCFGRTAEKTQLALNSGNGGKSYNGVSPYLSELTKDEQNLILYFRQIKNRQEILEYVKEHCFKDLEEDEFPRGEESTEE